MARYSVQFKQKAVARLLPPESAKVGDIARELGVTPSILERWRESAAMALVDSGAAKASTPVDAKADRKRIKTLERELGRKDKALAETAALLVLSKKVAAIFNKAEDE